MSSFITVNNQLFGHGNTNNQNINQSSSTLPALTEWNQNGPVATWINLLEKYKKDSKFKWSNLIHLKLDGFKVGIDLKKRVPELYEVVVETLDKLNVEYTDKEKLEFVNNSVIELVHFLKQLIQLVKDFRAIYNASNSPSRLMNRLAKRNPKVFKIRQVGSDKTRHSVTIEIVNLLVATETNKDCDIAKWAVSTKVLHYLLQLSKVVNIIPTKVKNGELQRSHFTSRQLFGSLDVLSIQSEETEQTQIGLMIDNLGQSRRRAPLAGQGHFEEKWSLFMDDRISASDFHLDQLDL